MQGQLERPPGRLNTAGLLDDLARLLPASSGQEGLQRVLARVNGAGRCWQRICRRLPPRPPAATASPANSSVATPRLPLSQSHLNAQPAPSSVATYRQQFTSAQTAALLGSLLAEAGGTPLPPGSENSIDQQPGGRYFQMVRACMLADVAQRFGKARRRTEPQPPALTTPPCDYLASVGRSVAALHGGSQQLLLLDSPAAAGPAAAAAAAAAPTAPTTTAAEVRQALHEEREVAADLSPCPADPAACRLSLRVLAPTRTQAALATKLGAPAARRQTHLRRRLQGGQVHCAVCAALRYAERAALQAPLLAAQRSSPQPNALVALLRVLRDGQALAAEVAAERAAAEERRRTLGAAVLAQHKEMKKAWREKRKREAAERMEALKASDMNEYMRLMAGKRHGKIDELLSQTDGCLRQLAARLRNAGAGTALLATASAGGSPSLSGSPQMPSAPGSSASDDAAEGGIAALEQSHETWNQLATAIQAGGVEQPELLTGGELREYQLKGLRWMVGLRRHGLNGILADEMGLGKTIQVIALVCHLVCEAQAAGGRQPRPFLIAVPASVLPNWESELAHWAPSLKVVCYRGDADAREEVWTRQLRGGRGGGAGGGTHVVLTTYDFLMNKNDKPRLARVHWGHLVVDEGHRLKNAGCKLNAELKGYRTDHRLLLTGTPLQNNLSELWSLLNFLLPDLFSSGEDFQAWFGGAERRGAPCGGGADGDSSDDEGAAELEARMLSEEEALIVTNRLHQVLRPFMLRRLKETVASELPQKREHVLRVPPSAYQQGLFRLMQRDLQGSGGVKGVNNVLMEMRNICNHPLISRMHPEGAELALPGHPLPAEVRLCSKLELLDRCLVKLRAGGHKVLLFCTMTRALDVVEDYLSWRGFPALRLDGNTGAAERGELVRRFNDPDGGAFVFLLSIRAGGVGLNLQGADTVIMYDTDWNPQMDLQAQARAHRMGQTKEVLVLRLVTSGTVEERVVGVSADKAALADRSITGGFFDGKTSAEERQRYLLETIRTSTQRGGAGGSGSSADGQLSGAQLNEMLARGESEVELFEAEDARMQATEEAAWHASLGAAAAAVAAAGTTYSRLAPEEEVAPLVAQAQQLLQPKKDPDEGRELGRGKRTRGAASYRDMGERDFNRLVQEGMEEGEAPVLLLAPTGGKRGAAAAKAVAAAAAEAAEDDGVVAAATAAKRRKLAGKQQQQQQQQQPQTAAAAAEQQREQCSEPEAAQLAEGQVEQPAEPAEPAESAEAAAAQPAKCGRRRTGGTGLAPKRQTKRKQPEPAAASLAAVEEAAQAGAELTAEPAAARVEADTAEPAAEAEQQPEASSPARAGSTAEPEAATAAQPDGAAPPPKRRRRNPRPAAPPAEVAQPAAQEPTMQPRAAEAATSEALAVALIAAAAEDAEAAPAEPAAAADAVHSVQGGVPSAPDQEAPAAPASAAAVPGSQAAAGGSVARGLALAAQLPAGTKIVGARSPGSSGSATWGIGVKLQKQSAWLSGLSREQAAVASDLLAVWRAGQGVSQRGKPLPAPLLPEAGYEEDSRLMERLRAASTAEAMKALLVSLLLHEAGSSAGAAGQQQQPDEAEAAAAPAAALEEPPVAASTSPSAIAAASPGAAPAAAAADVEAQEGATPATEGPASKKRRHNPRPAAPMAAPASAAAVGLVAAEAAADAAPIAPAATDAAAPAAELAALAGELAMPAADAAQGDEASAPAAACELPAVAEQAPPPKKRRRNPRPLAPVAMVAPAAAVDEPAAAGPAAGAGAEAQPTSPAMPAEAEATGSEEKKAGGGTAVLPEAASTAAQAAADQAATVAATPLDQPQAGAAAAATATVLPIKPRRRNPLPSISPAAAASGPSSEADKENSNMQPAAGASGGKRRWEAPTEKAAGEGQEGAAAPMEEGTAAEVQTKRRRQEGTACT